MLFWCLMICLLRFKWCFKFILKVFASQIIAFWLLDIYYKNAICFFFFFLGPFFFFLGGVTWDSWVYFIIGVQVVWVSGISFSLFNLFIFYYLLFYCIDHYAHWIGLLENFRCVFLSLWSLEVVAVTVLGNKHLFVNEL